MTVASLLNVIRLAGQVSRSIELPLQCADHAAERLRRSNQQRIGDRVVPARRKHLSLPGHSKLLLAGCLPSRERWSNRRAKGIRRSTEGMRAMTGKVCGAWQEMSVECARCL